MATADGTFLVVLVCLRYAANPLYATAPEVLRYLMVLKAIL